jgi:tRNA-specific 2-thiouridylase
MDLIATGHYARIRERSGIHHLHRGVDEGKDQSYFLWTLGQKELSRAKFPIGGLKKTQVRKLAETLKLPNAKKKDSQGLCFIGMIDTHDFLRRELKAKPGKVFDTAGNEIGEHDGAALYTVGQRHGFRILRNDRAVPYYVIGKSISENSVTVSSDIASLEHRGLLRITRLHETYGGALRDELKNVDVQTRYHGELRTLKKATFESDDTMDVLLKSPAKDVSPGQSAVFYRNDELIGGGILGE